MAGRIGHYMLTAAKQKLWPLSLSLGDIDIDVIAHALSRICRYGGHVRVPDGIYSVAEHSVRASYLFPETGPQVQLAILLHDAHEAYLGDVIRPLKKLHLYKFLEGIERRAQVVIHQTFGLPMELHDRPEVGRADRIMGATELRDVMDGTPEEVADSTVNVAVLPLEGRIVPWGIAETERKFKNRFDELGGVYEVAPSQPFRRLR